MKSAIKEPQFGILDSVIQQFHERSGLQIAVEARNVLLAPQQRFDALLMVRLGQMDIPFVAEIKNTIERPETLRHFLSTLRRPFLPMIVANTVSAKMKEHLRQRQIAFLCADGDFFLPLTNIAEEKPHPAVKRPEDRINLHSMHGMGYIKLGFALARIPETKNMTIADLSKKLKISMGSVSNVLREWKKSGLIERSGNETTIKNLKDFCRRWATVYIDQIRSHPSMFLGKYSSAHGPLSGFWRSVKLDSLERWGGEPALSLLTDELEPEQFILYSTGDLRMTLAKMKLSPSQNGDLTVFRSFWSDFPELFSHDSPAADPLVVYADLIYSGSSRNQKVAENMFNRMILGAL